MGFGRALVCWGLLGIGACAAPTHQALPPSASELPLEELLDRALPSVVLLLNSRSDGGLGYGAGLIIDARGTVLTNLHVVSGARGLAGLLYDKRRVSYMPRDGGLERYLFENQGSLVGARLIRADPALDLALVQLDADTSRFPKLTWADALPRIGSKVVAVGHPQRTVWTFTAGVVSATPQGAIQTDAPINLGSSGGPLLDAHGRVVGINFIKMMGGTDGIAFARPVELARPLLEHAAHKPPLDRGTAMQAARSCALAIERADVEFVAGCQDWERQAEVFREALRRSLSRLQRSHLPEGYREVVRAFDDRARVIEGVKAVSLAELGSGSPQELLADFFAPEPHATPGGTTVPVQALREARARWLNLPRLRRALDAQTRASRALDQRLLSRNGLKLTDRLSVRALLELVRLGIRAERVSPLGEDAAWVELSGHNADGTQYRTSELWVKAEDGWKQRSPPLPAERATLPEGFAPPLMSFEEQVEWAARDWFQNLSEVARPWPQVRARRGP